MILVPYSTQRKGCEPQPGRIVPPSPVTQVKILVDHTGGFGLHGLCTTGIVPCSNWSSKQISSHSNGFRSRDCLNPRDTNDHGKLARTECLSWVTQYG